MNQNNFFNKLDKIFSHPFHIIVFILVLIILLFVWCLLDEKEKYMSRFPSDPNPVNFDRHTKFPFLMKYISKFEDWINADHAQGTSTIYFVTLIITFILLYVLC